MFQSLKPDRKQNFSLRMSPFMSYCRVLARNNAGTKILHTVVSRYRKQLHTLQYSRPEILVKLMIFVYKVLSRFTVIKTVKLRLCSL